MFCKRESENCVRELEEKILKINQDPAGTGAGRQGAYVSTKKRLPCAGHVRRAVKAPFRCRVKSFFGQTEDLSQLRQGARPYLIKT